MRTFNGIQIFTNQLTNGGQLDLRYARITGNDQNVYLNSGTTISGKSLVSNTLSNFNSGVRISGNLILNGSIILVSEIGTVYTPTKTTYGGA